MLNLFKPRCPVDASAKEWIEARFSWLTNELGIQRLTTGKTIVPTKEFLPMQYDCTEEGITDLMIRVANYMDVDANRLDLIFYEDKSPSFEGVTNERTAGLYAEQDGRFNICLEINSLDDPSAVIATLAHEIGHVVLLGQNRIANDEPDHEPLTDLVTVFLGLGIFLANSALHETNIHGSGYSAWSVGKRGYMSMHMLGYAMALYSLARGDNRPSWATHLRPDAKAYLARGIRYILKTSDCSFAPAIQRCG